MGPRLRVAHTVPSASTNAAHSVASLRQSSTAALHAESVHLTWGHTVGMTHAQLAQVHRYMYGGGGQLAHFKVAAPEAGHTQKGRSESNYFYQIR